MRRADPALSLPVEQASQLRHLGDLQQNIAAFVTNQFWQIAVFSLDHRFNPIQVPNAWRNRMPKFVEH